MTGAIAGVSCANGNIHHFVCVKEDGTLGHLTAVTDEAGEIVWFNGNLSGRAHGQSRIAIGCPNPTDPSPQLDVLYQLPSGDVVRSTRNATTQQWGESESNPPLIALLFTDLSVFSITEDQSSYVYIGTSLAVNYRNADRPFYWYVNEQLYSYLAFHA
jgi:hypothetical protein